MGRKQGSASSQISEVNEPVTKMDVLSWPSLWALIKLMTKLLTSKDSDPVLKEVESYLKERAIDRKEPPLRWWKENQNRFPLISRVAKRYLTIPITSTPAERVFSTAGLTVTRLRSCLTPEHVNMLVYLNKNASFTL